VDLCEELRPDLVLMAVGMPRMDGMEATRKINARHPAVSVLMVTAHPSPDYMLDAVRAGAAGYLLKTATRDEIFDAIRKVLRNEFPLDQELTAHLIQRLAREAAP
jgi:DNA-binding NarL/FixJ family response regulator